MNKFRISLLKKSEPHFIFYNLPFMLLKCRVFIFWIIGTTYLKWFYSIYFNIFSFNIFHYLRTITHIKYNGLFCHIGI